MLKSNGRPLTQRASFWGFIFICPWLLGFAVFTAGPMLASLVLSFCKYDLKTVTFIGLGNYHRMFTGSEHEYFFKSLTNTALYVLFSVPMGLTGSLLLAVMLNQKVKGVSVFRTLYYLPSLTPAVASALVWMWVFHPEYGILNNFLTMNVPMPSMGAHGLTMAFRPMIAHPPEWLQSSTWALPAFIIMSLWGIGGSRMIIFLAGLQGISDEYYEAARIDGAGAWHQFRHITIPLLTPTIFFNMILGVIGAFQIFTAAFIISGGTGGGPNNSLLFYVLYLYRHAFEQFHMGYAAALAWVLFIILFTFTLLQFKHSSTWVHYEGEGK
jgi:multiple sugar transport system permease protein